MTPNELYRKKPIRMDKDFYSWAWNKHNHIPEINNYEALNLHKNERISVHWYKDEYLSDNVNWRLSALQLDGTFVMIDETVIKGNSVQRARRFITNKPKYNEMVAYVRTLWSDIKSNSDVIDSNENIENLTCFNWHQNDGCFESI